jgi:hypothetical protein
MSSISNDWLCPISYALMRDPVIAPDGYTYERSAISQWLSSNAISPMTRIPMTISDLVPNRALQSTIEEYIRVHPDYETQLSGLTPAMPLATGFTSSPTTVQGKKFLASDGKQYLHVRVQAPSTGPRQPIVLLPIIDNSGSMGESVGAAGGLEDMGFTRLDLVKHAVRTMAAILGPSDYMGIVTFSTEAKVILSPIRMDASGKHKINTVLDNIYPDSSTNIYDGIKKAAALLADPAYADHNIVGMLLTDGFPTINPPRGIVPSLAALRCPARWTLHAFGFGYSLDSALCVDIATWGGGLFGFIPDATMVGTVFINTLAHVLSTANLDSSFTYKPAPLASEIAIHVGPVTYGQSRDYLFEVQDSVMLNGSPVESSTPDHIFVHHLYKKAIAHAIAICKSNDANATTTATQHLKAFENTHRENTDPNIQSFLKDLCASKEGEGQVGMAPAYFQRWGEHYLRAYLRAQELQQCMNFKDPGLQIYGGELFHALQDVGDKIFCELPPPKPSRVIDYNYGYAGSVGAGASAAGAVNMSVFHNASGGCFAPETIIRMADNSHKRICDINRSDLVWTPSGPANVRAVVVCGSKNRAQPMTMLDDLVITPWHPVRVSASSPVWKFPAEIAGYSDRLISTVYNLVLDTGHIVNADGWEAVTLGHGFTDPVVAHSYFGTDRVINDLMKQNGWSEGRPTYINLTAIKSPSEDSSIIGWIDDV